MSGQGVGRPRLLDLFCGHGGAAMGYHRAGFEVVGVDLEPWSFYPFEQHQGDAFEYLADHWREFDAIHASPPCQRYSRMKTSTSYDPMAYDDLLQQTVDALAKLPLPWVVENVPGAPGSFGMLLCGSMFEGLQYPRHRYFAGGGWAFPIMAPHSCNHAQLLPGSPYNYGQRPGRSNIRVEPRDYLDGLGMDWVPTPGGPGWPTKRVGGGMFEGIPPAYTEWIGTQLLASLRAVA